MQPRAVSRRSWPPPWQPGQASSSGGFCSGRRLTDEAAVHTEVIGRKHPRVRARNRFGPQQVDAVGRPAGALEQYPIESDLSVLVLAVQAHEVDGRVLGVAVIVWPQSRPDIAIGRTDPFVLGVAHVEIAEDDG